MSTVTPTLDPPIVAVRSARRRVARRTTYALSGLTVVWVAVFLVRITQGDFLISLPDAVRIILGAEIPGASYILMESKLPRAVLGTGVGVALGLAGAIFQTTLHNELASPDIVGVTLGASAAAVFGIVVLGQGGPVISALAVAGALGVALTVRALADGHNGYRLVLLGIGISAVMSAVIQYLFTRVDEFNATKVLQWLGGSLSNVDWRAIGLFFALAVPVVGAIAWRSKVLRVAELGDDLRAGLGAGPGSVDALIALAVILAGLATAVAGPVAFVAFLTGPISRALTGGRTRLVAAALVGAVIVVLGDHIGAYLLGDINLPVGIITGAIGAPALIWLIATGRTTRGSR